MPTSTRNWIRVLVMAPAVLSLLQCDGDTTQVVCRADLGTTDAGKRVQSFIDTSYALVVAADQIDSDMLNVCRSMARDLGIPAAALEPAASTNARQSPGAATDAACRRVRSETDKIIRDHLVANARLALVSTPSVCTVDAGTRLRCEQECDPATVIVNHLECTPGHAYGQCTGSCTGRCTSICAGTCTGSCSGSCAGTCSGNCNGTCVGTCAAKNPDGTCYGACTGTCMGVCDGSCAGGCSGTCGGSCSSPCTGGCEGDCSAWVSPPTCTQVQQITTVEECKTNCDARAHFEARCSEPVVTVSYGYAATTTQKAALDRLVTALRNNHADFLRVAARATMVRVDAGGGYAIALGGIASTARQVGPGAAACVADAMTQVDVAAAKVQVSVNANIAVSTSLSTMGGVAAP